MALAEATVLRIEVAYSPRSEAVDVRRLELPAGSVLGDALQASGLLLAHGLVGQELSAGIWGHLKPLVEPLRDRDRVEIYRPLQVDPKEARRLRYKQKPKVKRVLRGRAAVTG